MRSERFHTPTAPRVSISNTAGHVRVETIEGEETAVELVAMNDAGRELVDEATVEQRGESVVVELPERRRLLVRDARVGVTVRSPHGTHASIKTVSADTDARGVFGDFEHKTVSGDVRIAEVSGEASVKSVSGDVRVGPVGGNATVQTVSGDLAVERVAGTAELRTVSGDLRLGSAGGPVTSNTVSGDQDLRSVASGAVQAKSVSGDVTVAVAPGSRVWMDARSMSGSTKSELDLSDAPSDGDDGPLVEIRVNTLSGDIRLARAT